MRPPIACDPAPQSPSVYPRCFAACVAGRDDRRLSATVRVRLTGSRACVYPPGTRSSGIAASGRLPICCRRTGDRHGAGPAPPGRSSPASARRDAAAPATPAALARVASCGTRSARRHQRLPRGCARRRSPRRRRRHARRSGGRSLRRPTPLTLRIRVRPGWPALHTTPDTRRIVVLYTVSASIAMISRFERAIRRDAVEPERARQRERDELSRTIHDTTAQTAYMIGLGIDAATKLAGDGNEELKATLAATSELSRWAMWDLRKPIDMGHLFEGRGLGRVLESHIATFTRITSVHAEMGQSGHRVASCDRDPHASLFHRPQRPHQRVSACWCQQGRGPAGLLT